MFFRVPNPFIALQVSNKNNQRMSIVIIVKSKKNFFKVIFDTDPAPSGASALVQNEMMAQAMIRGVMDESGEQFVAYFLPTTETMEKRQSDFRQVIL